MSREGLDPVRGDVPGVGHPLPVHQGRGRGGLRPRGGVRPDGDRRGAPAPAGAAPSRQGGGQLGALRRHWRPLVAFAALEIIVPWGLLSTAERKLPSSLAGLLIAAVPIISVVTARLTGGTERLSPRRWAGLVIGLAGVALLAAPDLGGGSGLAGGRGAAGRARLRDRPADRGAEAGRRPGPADDRGLPQPGRARLAARGDPDLAAPRCRPAARWAPWPRSASSARPARSSSSSR